MLRYEIAKELYGQIKARASQSTDKDFIGFYETFLKDAVGYAENRTAWSFMDDEERAGDDKSRSIKHDAYISMLDAVCRNLGIDGIYEILPDRKTIGDFACYIALFIGLEWR